MNCKKTCKCGLDLNLGVKETAEFKAARKIGLMEYNDSTGAANSLDMSVAWDQAFWDALISAANFSDRLQPLTISEFNPSTEDPVTVTRPSGKVVKVRDGVTNYEIFVDNGDGTLYDALKSLECKKLGFILEDSCGSIAGKECIADELRVIEIEQDTFSVSMVMNNDSDIQRIRVTFSLALNESPAVTVVPASEMDVLFSDIDAICDVVADAATVKTATQLVVVLEAANSFGKKDVPAEGLDTPANWTITDSAGATSVPTAVTEAPVGTYTIDYVAVALGLANFHYLDTEFEANVNETLA